MRKDITAMLVLFFVTISGVVFADIYERKDVYGRGRATATSRGSSSAMDSMPDVVKTPGNQPLVQTPYPNVSGANGSGLKKTKNKKEGKRIYLKSNMEGVEDKNRTGSEMGEMPVNSKFDQKGAFDGIIDDAMGGGFGSGFMGSTGMEMGKGTGGKSGDSSGGDSGGPSTSGPDTTKLPNPSPSPVPVPYPKKGETDIGSQAQGVQGNLQNKSQGFSNISQFGHGTGKNVINNLK